MDARMAGARKEMGALTSAKTMKLMSWRMPIGTPAVTIDRHMMKLANSPCSLSLRVPR